ADRAQEFWNDAILPHELLEEVTTYYLSQNFSNPFNPMQEASTTILYSLVEPSDVRLAIFDLLGREVRVLDSGFKEDSEHIVRWNGKDTLGKLVSSGIYIYRLEVDGQTLSRKLVVLK
ncbi:T9SS type A sorting domain-containing protein, partial [Candidatus Neomarinimicrobiota bacterium]